MNTIQIKWRYHHCKVTDKIVLHMFTMFKEYMDYQVAMINNNKNYNPNNYKWRACFL